MVPRMKNILEVLAFLSFSLSIHGASAASLDPSPDTVLLNGKIVTVDVDFTTVEALAIKDGKFVGVGETEEMRALIGQETEVIDLQGKMVVPGFIDGHAHMDREGLKFLYPSLTGARSINDVLNVIEHEVSNKAPGEWIVTMPLGDYPYFQNGPELLLEGRYPNRWDLDKVSPNNPVYIRGIWYSWRGQPPIVSIANSYALELAQITVDTLPPHLGLEIVKHEQTGEPTGVFVESGSLGTMEFSLMKLAPRFTHEQRIEALRESMKRYNAVGTTSIYEGHGVSSNVMSAYKELWERDEMTVRSTLVVSPAWGAAPDDSIEEVLRDWSAYAGGRGIGDNMLKLSGIYTEVGSSPQLEIRAQERPYSGWAGYGVDQILSPERGSLYDLVLAATKANLRPNGDAENLTEFLEIFERVNEQIPISDRRFVLIHVDYATESQQELMNKLGIIPTIITTRLWRDGSSRTTNVSREQLNTYLPLRSYVEKHVPFVLVTDNIPINPLHALWAVVARQDMGTGEAISPEQKISREEALRALTINGAYLSFDEQNKGSIELGKLADLVVLSDDLFSIPEDQIKEIEIMMTMVGGKIVYIRE